jgi:hypothetical protein
VTTQHAGMSLERWRGQGRGRQILAIANEMNRASKLFASADIGRLRTSYERILALTDLTIQAADTRGLRRELLRWRDLVAAQYVADTPDRTEHGRAFRALLQLHPEAWRQLPWVTGAATS